MIRTAAISALAVAVFGLAACFAMTLLDGSDARAPEPTHAPAAIDAHVDVAPRAAELPPARVVVAPALAAAPRGDAFRNWSGSVAVLPGELGEMGPSLKLGLDSARNNDMAFCFRDL